MGEWKSLKIDSGTGWKDIYREVGTGWKALTWEGVAIDVGAACSDRGSTKNLAGYTRLMLENPANANGTITNICLYMYSVVSGDVYAGIFEDLGSKNYKCGSAVNLGYLSVGVNNETVSLTVETGDLIGLYSEDTNYIERDSSGSGYMSKSGNHCVVNDEGLYSTVYNNTFSLYGTG